MQYRGLITYWSLDFILWHTITHAHKQQTAIHMIPATTDTLIMSTVRMSMSCLDMDSLSAESTRDNHQKKIMLWWKRHWDPARIWIWVFWILVRWLITYWSLDFNLWHTITRAHKQQTAIHMIPATTNTLVFIHRHNSNLRLDLSICRLYSALVSTLCCSPSKLGISSRHLACAVRTPQGRLETFLLSEKSHTKCFASLRQIVKGCFICRVIWWQKKDIEIRNVSMDKYHLSSTPMPELQWLNW